MIITQHYEECLSQAAYLIGDEITGKAIVVDPLRDIDQYLESAAAHGLTIVGVVLTHFHADFLAGHLELAAATGAWVGVGDRGRPAFDARLLADGERISLGDVEVEVMATPGHTPESISLLVFEHADDDVANSVLSGDALFVGDVGRVDLQAIFGADPARLAVQQFDTIQHRFMGLPDAVKVYPAHGAGSACGKNISEDHDSTIGRERATNPACKPMEQDEFVAMITTGQVPAPAYFVKDAALNRELHRLFQPEDLRSALSIDEFRELRALGAVVLDCRDAETFAAQHVSGALNVPLDGRFAETAGMFLGVDDTSVILVTEPGRVSEARTKLARIGLDSVAGYLPADVLEQLAADAELVTTERLDVDHFESERASSPETVIIDVRGPGEYEDGAIPGSVNIPLPQLSSRLAEIPLATRVLVNCQGGWRSSVATSFLNANGFTAVDLRGGYAAWSSVPA
jgi:hydroxyacylglutathione hydrolase